MKVRINLNKGYGGTRILELVTSANGGIRIGGPNASPYITEQSWLCEINPKDMRKAALYIEGKLKKTKP